MNIAKDLVLSLYQNLENVLINSNVRDFYEEKKIFFFD